VSRRHTLMHGNAGAVARRVTQYVGSPNVTQTRQSGTNVISATRIAASSALCKAIPMSGRMSYPLSGLGLGGKPIGSEPDIYIERHGERGCARHLLADKRHDRIDLLRRDLEDEFVVHLEKHLGAETLPS
jgi:hypothetical protein